MASAEALGDVMECPICKEVYIDPRVLPCGHTICFTCIERWKGDRQPGQSLECPCCRQEFTLPRELPKNYSFVDILGKIKEPGSVYCDQHADKKIDMYCVNCDMRICTMCFIKSHNGHVFSESVDLRKQMTNDVVAGRHNVGGGKM